MFVQSFIHDFFCIKIQRNKTPKKFYLKQYFRHSNKGNLSLPVSVHIFIFTVHVFFLCLSVSAYLSIYQSVCHFKIYNIQQMTQLLICLLSLYLSLCLSIYLSLYLSACLPLLLSILSTYLSLYIFLFICLSVYLSVQWVFLSCQNALSAFLSFCLSVLFLLDMLSSLFVFLSLFICLYPSITLCLSVYSVCLLTVSLHLSLPL